MFSGESLEPKKVATLIHEKITEFKELITGEKYGENILLEPYIPILLEF